MAAERGWGRQQRGPRARCTPRFCSGQYGVCAQTAPMAARHGRGPSHHRTVLLKMVKMASAMFLHKHILLQKNLDNRNSYDQTTEIYILKIMCTIIRLQLCRVPFILPQDDRLKFKHRSHRSSEQIANGHETPTASRHGPGHGEGHVTPSLTLPPPKESTAGAGETTGLLPGKRSLDVVSLLLLLPVTVLVTRLLAFRPLKNMG